MILNIQTISYIYNLLQLHTPQQMQQQPKKYPNHNVQNYRASMVLAAVGDAMGYKNGDWQFLTNSTILHQQMMELTNNKGPLALNITFAWKYSDDTVMHIATAEGLIKTKSNNKNKNQVPLQYICQNLAVEYKKCWSRMSGRAPGRTTGKSIQILMQDGSNWNKIPYSDRSCGCGASMRSACIGLAYYDNTERLIALGIQSGRMTHHNPGGYMGSVISAYFTGLAVKGVEPCMWAAYFLKGAVPIAQAYINKAGRQVKANLSGQNWKRSITSVEQFAKKRNLSLTTQMSKQAQFPQKYGILQRDKFYRQISWGSWPGALGIDSVLIAYDAMLSCKGSWQEMCLRGILHGGDNDSTGTIAGAWFGAYYGLKGVPSNHYKELEDIKKLEYLGEQLFKLTEN